MANNVVNIKSSSAPDTAPLRVAVYGTLMSEYHRAHVITANGGKFLGTGTLRGILLHLSAYPALVLPDPNIEWTKPHVRDDIPCEVYEISKDLLSILDGIEGYPDLYTRSVVPTEHGDAFVYHMRTSRINHNAKLIVQGGWKGYLTPSVALHESTATQTGGADKEESATLCQLPETARPVQSNSAPPLPRLLEA